MAPQTVTPAFPFTGTWYDYITGDSLAVTNTNQTVSFKAGEYHVWTSKRVKNPFLNSNQSSIDELEKKVISVYPNPTNGQIVFNWEGHAAVAQFAMYDLTGKKISERKNLENGETIDISEHNRGIFIYEITLGGTVERGKLILE